MQIVKKISYWARNNIYLTQILLTVVFFVMGYAATELGIYAYATGCQIPQIFIYFLIAIGAWSLLKEHENFRSDKDWWQQRKGLFISLVAFVTLFGAFGNQLPTHLQNQTKSLPTLISAVTITHTEIPQKINPFTEHLKKRVEHKIESYQKKGKFGRVMAVIGLILLLIIGIVAVLGGACGAACGDPAIGIAVAITGIGAVVLSIVLLVRMKRRRRKDKQNNGNIG